tara:strand:+ start:1990 stop:2568 length:579 start_codon:yes stop_codon:yes gene_type:complete
MWEIFLATVISLSAGVRQPRQVPTAPFDYELSYKIENEYKGLDLSFRHDYEREDGDFFNDIRGELNYKKGLIVVKEDYKQIASKDLYQFNSDIRVNIRGLSAGYGVIWDLDDKLLLISSLGYSKKTKIGKWELETENDIYLTKPITYQTESKIVYNITDNIGIGLSGNYINLLNGFDYNAQTVITIKLGGAK